MYPIEWSDTLLLDYAPMDAVHREFVDLLASVHRAPDTALAPAWEKLVEHTQRHFHREDEWMRRTHFAAAGTHTLQHRVVLNVLREGLAMARAGEFSPVREMAVELGAWFAKHTQSLDAALALHMRRQMPGANGQRRTHRAQAASTH